MKVVIVQRICTNYRAEFFDYLSRNSDHEITVITSDYNNEKYPKFNGVKELTHTRLKRIFAIVFFLNLGKRSFPIFINPTIINHILKEKPEVIITEGESNLINNIFVNLYSKITKTPYLWWGLGRVISRKPSIIRRMFNPLIKYLVSSATGILAYSTLAKEFYISQGSNEKNTFLMHNSINDEIIKQQIMQKTKYLPKFIEKMKLHDKKVILFVGAFEKSKKIDNLILAFQLLQKQLPNSKLLLVGDGPIRRELEELVRYNNIQNVVFCGKQYEDVSLYFLASDIFVLPGLGGLAINHAMAHGLPVVATSADGTERDLILHGKNGFLIEKDNIDVLKNTLLNILSTDDYLNLKSEAKRTIEDRINIRGMMEEFNKAINYCILDNKK